MSNAADAVVWTATGHFLTRVGPEADPAEQRRIDDVVVDDWIYGADRSVLDTTVSELAPADRRHHVVVL